MLYCWLDIETTGLKPELKHEILEVSAVVTDGLFKTVEEFNVIIRPTTKCVWTEFVTQMHQKSGLTDQLKNGLEFEEAGDQLVAFLSKHAENEQLVLTGNSVHFDRNFLTYYRPEIDRFFSHRHLDISSVRRLITELFGMDAKAPVTPSHRSRDDINCSQEELKYYINKYIKTTGLVFDSINRE